MISYSIDKGFDLIAAELSASMNRLYQGVPRFTPGAIEPWQLVMALRRDGIEIEKANTAVVRENDKRPHTSQAFFWNGREPDTKILAYSFDIRRGRMSGSAKVTSEQRSKEGLYETIHINVQTHPVKNAEPYVFAQDAMTAIMRAYNTIV